MTRIDVDELTEKATHAALDVIDGALDRHTKKAVGPCGDKLAYGIHRMIEAALIELAESSDAPEGVEFAYEA